MGRPPAGKSLLHNHIDPRKLALDDDITFSGLEFVKLNELNIIMLN